MSAAMMLRHSFKQNDIATAIEHAVQEALKSNPTRDLGGNAGTAEFTTAVINALAMPAAA